MCFGAIDVILGAMLMLGIFVLFGKSYTWEPAQYQESTDSVSNPERGWYHMYGYWISDNKQYDWAQAQGFEREGQGDSLELIEINIQTYRNGAISQKGMEDIRQIFQCLKRSEKRGIIRFLYDWDGNGMAVEPERVETVLGHMEQVGPVLREYENQIYVMQGIFVGSWAEMHSSKFLSDENVRTLIQKLADVTSEKTMLSVRTPAFWRVCSQQFNPLAPQQAFSGQLASRIGLFNDGLLSSDTDYGTYGIIDKESARSFGAKWKREDELAFQEQLCRYVPNGGESGVNNSYNDINQVLQDMPRMQLSYVSGEFGRDVINKWKSTVYTGNDVYNGKSLYDYIGDHLGYRFVLQEAELCPAGFLKRLAGKKDVELNLYIQNTGFANLYYEKKTELIFRGERGDVVIPVETDARTWQASEVTQVSTIIDTKQFKKGSYQVYLRIYNDAAQGQEIRLANQNLYEEGLGANYLGTISIK